MYKINYSFIFRTTVYIIVCSIGEVSLELILSFATGVTSIPPMGFSKEPSINFSEYDVYPTASTCILQLTLPTCYDSFTSFKSALDTGFTMHGGFGRF